MQELKNRGVFVRTEEENKEELMSTYLEGRNSVLEAMRAERTIEKIMVQKGNVDGTLKKIVAKAKMQEL